MAHASNQPDAQPSTPMTLKDRVIGAGLALLFGAFGLWMLLRPNFDLSSGGESPTRHKTRLIFYLLDLAWSRPTGVILLLLAVLMLWSAARGRAATPGHPVA